MERFVDRDEELSRLRECYESDRGELAVIYGRRRLGKTQLAQHSLRDRDDAVVYQGTETTAQFQLDEFIDVASWRRLGALRPWSYHSYVRIHARRHYLSSISR
ncbi:hypothetical protein GCM10009021_28040 [Halarchaeum nitratireducens]|uniref:ATPase domain-containing protein n=1 Tax=Halarchaeum nitratireducens TaxID=489913 RepID=A0A830GFQ3_9EURY|nr:MULTISPECIES: ATP-binding protein [Halarchaeum]MBP2252347.1 AAA+ ATPase superfamily predicted ATPase [Halarchaeum solikamskense]GGN24624.1 hypothetical protein GCM10009021_28040 [Halarchaeum nitratireducens]